MRLPIFGLVLAAMPILISSGLSRAAGEQATPAPGLSPQAISRYEQALQSVSPATVREALALLQASAGASSPSAALAALKAPKAELEDLKNQLCAAAVHC